jgi:hypothetical protein
LEQNAELRILLRCSPIPWFPNMSERMGDTRRLVYQIR